jgi:hypothetical protein
MLEFLSQHILVIANILLRGQENRAPPHRSARVFRLGDAVGKLQREARAVAEVLIADWGEGPDSRGKGFWGAYSAYDDVFSNEMAALLGYKCECLRSWTLLVGDVHRTIGQAPRLWPTDWLSETSWMLELRQLVKISDGHEPLLVDRADWRDWEPGDHGEWQPLQDARGEKLTETALTAGLLVRVDLSDRAAVESELARSTFFLARVRETRKRLADFIRSSHTLDDLMERVTIPRERQP